jgi:hypothetical protein
MTQQPWGRVADDGTVYVRLADGEAVVGSWQTGSTDEALAFYSRKYDGAVVEANLLEQRLRKAGVDAESALAAIGRLRAQVEQPAMVGDLAALTAKLDALVTLVDERRAAEVVERKEAKAKALSAREDVIARAEKLATSTQWKATGEAFRSLLEEWKALPRVERSVEQALWKRFSAARTAFDRARRTHFATLDTQRDEAKAVKEKLIKEAESLSTSTDWGATSSAYRDLMTRWKAAGRANRQDDDALWQRFKAAQDAFFAARDASNAERDVEQRANLEKKTELVVQAEALLPVTRENVGSVKSSLRDISTKWEAIGHVPRNDRNTVESRLRKVEDAVRAVEDEQWRRSNPEARARAQGAVDQLEVAISQLDADIAKAEAAGNTKKADEARAARAARSEWLEQARKALEEFSG